MPFPPALLAQGPACAVAETYASSHPLSALQLINPPLSMQRAAQRYPNRFRTALPEFDFEAHFPVRVVWTADELAAQAQEAIVEADYRLEFERTRTLYLSAETRVETLSRASLPQAEEALRLVEIGYRNGRFPLIEVLAAAEARDAIRENLIEAEETRATLAARLIWLAAE